MEKRDQDTLSEVPFLDFFRRIIILFMWMVGVFLFIAFMLIIAYFVLPLFNIADQADVEVQLRSIYSLLEPILGGIWEFLRPVLQLVIVVVLLRWLLFPPSKRKASEQLGQVVNDVPSLLAILVIGTFCLLPLLSADIPDALSNVALVIVGFYFGQERLKILQRERGIEEETTESPAQEQLAQDGDLTQPPTNASEATG